MLTLFDYLPSQNGWKIRQSFGCHSVLISDRDARFDAERSSSRLRQAV